MASWNIPALVNKIAEDIPAIKGLLTALFKWTDADTTDVPTGAQRLQSVSGGRQIQEYSGSAWASVGKLMHDCDMLDGKHASTSQTANTIPVRDANGTIPGNVSGNAATATEASSLASGYTVPIANGGTGATTAANARSALGANNASNISSGILAIDYGGTGSSTKNFVDLTNNQNVGGVKTFSSEIKSTAATLISGVMTGVSNADTTRGQQSSKVLTAILDKDGKRFASLDCAAHTDGSRTLYLTMRNRADTGWITNLAMKEFADGTVQTLAKTPPAAANDTQIATTAWGRSQLVQKSGDTMTGQLVINKSNSANGGGLKLTGDGQNFAINMCDTAITKGTAPASQRYCGIEWYGNDNSNYNKRLGMIEFGLSTANISSAFLRAYNCTTATNTGTCSISCNVDASGNAYTSAPTPAAKDNSTKIATTAFCKDFITGLSVSGKTITYTRSTGATGTITTQDTNTTYSAATQSANGLMSAADKKKLDGIATSANNYTHPTTAGNKHIPSGGSSGQILRWKASGEAQWGSDNNTTYSAATQSANGLMSAADKKKLDGIATGATKGAVLTQKLASFSVAKRTSVDKTITVTNGSIIFAVSSGLSPLVKKGAKLVVADVYVATSTSVTFTYDNSQNGASTTGRALYGY